MKLYDDGKRVCWYCRTGNIVTVICKNLYVETKNAVKLGVMPEELRPSVRSVTLGIIPGYGNICQLEVGIAGNVEAYSLNGTGNFFATLTYPIV
ncbi:MAG: hypothetical protein MSA23_05975 [Collinsella sp.]|nr:hypothetical protein [Collinsella sp.]